MKFYHSIVLAVISAVVIVLLGTLCQHREIQSGRVAVLERSESGLSDPVFVLKDEFLNHTATLLLVDGQQFLATFSTERRTAAEDMATKVGGVVRDFGIHISQADPHTYEATNWKKVEGFSVWK